MPLGAGRRTVARVTAVALVLLVALVLVVKRSPRVEKVAVVVGAVLADNEDWRLQRPIRNATVTESSGDTVRKVQSEASGLFTIRLEPAVVKGDLIRLKVEHPDYRPFAITTPVTDEPYVIRLAPAARQVDAAPSARQTRLTNIRVRYAIESTSTTNVGTAVRTFDVVNQGSVPCAGHPPCSPDGKWKAKIGSFSLNLGEKNQEFRNVRVSCIAGPCPFSTIEVDRFSRGGPSISVSVRNWSDSVTYLLEAEVAQTMESEMIRHTYPVTFRRSMNFTLPPRASGTCIEADMDGSQIVFPLGPELRLSWAACHVENAPAGTKQYTCELKPGYRFE
jgi:hypothetical protein